MEAGRVAFGELLREHGLAVDAEALRPWARWVTPVGEVRRYDTRFFVAALPTGVEARHVTTEAELGALARRSAPRSSRRNAASAGCCRRRSDHAGVAAEFASVAEAMAARRTSRSMRSRATAAAIAGRRLGVGRAARRHRRADPAEQRASDASGLRAAAAGHAARRRRAADQPGPDDARRHQHLAAARIRRVASVDRRRSGRADDPPTSTSLLAAAGEVALILLTHGHLDHSQAAPALHEATGAPVRALDPAHCHGDAEPLDRRRACVDGGRGLDLRCWPRRATPPTRCRSCSAHGAAC